LQHPIIATRLLTRLDIATINFNQLLLNHHRLQPYSMASQRDFRLQQAIADTQTFSGASLRSIAASNDVDYTTLSRRLKGQLPRKTAHQRQQLLSSEQEDLLKRWIIDLEQQGHAPSFNTVRELAAIVSAASGGPNKVGKNWIQRFIQRHPEIRSKVGKKIQSQRVDSTSPEALAACFQPMSVRRAFKRTGHVLAAEEHELSPGTDR
jgi:hypothetical protein